MQSLFDRGTGSSATSANKRNWKPARKVYGVLDGITVMTRSAVDKIIGSIVFINQEEVRSEKILLCVGRNRTLEMDEFDKIGLSYNAEGINVDNNSRTNIPHVYMQ